MRTIKKVPSLGLPFVLIISYFFLSAGVRQEKELFPGEGALRNCRINLPLTNKDKDQPYCIKAERDNKGKPIILIHWDKKAKTATYYRYHLFSHVMNGKMLFFLQTPDDYAEKQQRAIVYNYNANTDRFYVSECFDEKLSSNKDLQEKLVEGTEEVKTMGL